MLTFPDSFGDPPVRREAMRNSLVCCFQLRTFEFMVSYSICVQSHTTMPIHKETELTYVLLTRIVCVGFITATKVKIIAVFEDDVLSDHPIEQQEKDAQIKSFMVRPSVPSGVILLYHN